MRREISDQTFILDKCIQRRKEMESEFLKNKELEKIQEQQRLKKLNEMYTVDSERQNERRKMSNFKMNVKTDLLKEAIYSIYNKAIGPLVIDENADVIKHKIVSDFVEEQGTTKLLNKFKKASCLLSEYYLLINEYTDIFCEKAKETDNYSDISDINDKDDFYEKLNLTNNDEVVSAIRHRVSDAMDQFISANIKEKNEIEEMLKNAQEKIDSTDKKEFKESYDMNARRRIHDMQRKRDINLYEAMILNVSNSVYKNKALSESFLTNNALDMDKIGNACTLMYGMLETANTTKMINIDREYITNLLSNLNA